MKTALLPDDTWNAIRPIFAKEWPNEAIVAVWADRWEHLPNVSPTPMLTFQIAAGDHARLLADPPQLLLHSHPNGEAWASDEDTLGQLSTGWNWGIVAVQAAAPDFITAVHYPECWGDGVEIPPLEGRTYLWGIRDCWTLARDYLRLQGHPVPNCPRAEKPSLYPATHWGSHAFTYWPPRLGFRKVARDLRQPGDVALLTLKSSTLNHCGVWLGEERLLHHIAKQNSGVWQIGDEEKFITRYNVQFIRWTPNG